MEKGTLWAKPRKPYHSFGNVYCKKDDNRKEVQEKTLPESNNIEKNEDATIPIWKRYTLTITEAAYYYHIGETKLRTLVQDNPNAGFAMINGNRVLIKRKKFEQFLDEATAI